MERANLIIAFFALAKKSDSSHARFCCSCHRSPGFAPHTLSPFYFFSTLFPFHSPTTLIPSAGNCDHPTFIHSAGTCDRPPSIDPTFFFLPLTPTRTVLSSTPLPFDVSRLVLFYYRVRQVMEQQSKADQPNLSLSISVGRFLPLHKVLIVFSFVAKYIGYSGRDLLYGDCRVRHYPGRLLR